MIQTKDVTYRHIAKMLASALPIQGAEFGQKVNQYLETIKGMNIETKNALKSAYIFSRKAPREEREDLFQDIALAVYKAKTKDAKLAYAIARCDWKDFWKKYKIRQHLSLDSVTSDDTGNPITLGEMLVGEVEFERKQCDKLDAEAMYNSLPVAIKPIIDKRLIGKALNNSERNKLNRYVKKDGYKLILN